MVKNVPLLVHLLDKNILIKNFPSGFNILNFPTDYFKATQNIGNTAFIANAGTNLNTSLLALESSGNLAAIKAKTDNLDVLLSTRALEAGGNLAAIAGKDFATQTTLALIKAKTDNLDVLLSTRFKPTDSIGNTSFGATQATRTSLLMKPEREDLLLKDLDFATNVALQSYLAAVANQKHKIYVFSYECDADGVYYFSATVNGSAYKFGRRITKGVYAQTLIHPIVCDVNTALEFMSNGGNSKAWIQYKTEV